MQKKHLGEKEALETILIQNKKQLAEQQRSYEKQISDLRDELRDTLTELTCLKDMSGLIKLNDSEKRCTSILVEDLKTENTQIKHQIDTLKNENVGLTKTLTLITEALNIDRKNVTALPESRFISTQI